MALMPIICSSPGVLPGSSSAEGTNCSHHNTTAIQSNVTTLTRKKKKKACWQENIKITSLKTVLLLFAPER